MTTYESKIGTLSTDAQTAYTLLSDLRNVEKFKDRIPSDKIQDLEFDADSCHFSVSPVGKVGLCIVDREEPKTIKFGAENSPVQFNLWIQLKQLSETDTKVKLTIKAELPMMIKTMVGGKIQSMLDMLSDTICSAINSK